VLVVATFGSYAIDGTMAGPITLFVFSILGWAMVRYGYPGGGDRWSGLLLGSLLGAEPAAHLPDQRRVSQAR
jgi:putative tricarboxylic transport membrane protein